MKQLPRPSNMQRVHKGDMENNQTEQEQKIVNRIHKRGKIRLIKDYLIEYLENSNLHGLKYIGEKKRMSTEKIFWAVMFICSVVLCAVMINKIWIKWNDTPVIVTFAEKSTPVWQIPYPAVTICSATKAMPTRFNFTKYFHLSYNYTAYDNLTEKEKNTFEHVSMVCDTKRIYLKGHNFSVDVLKEVSPTIKEVFMRCSWNRQFIPCEDLFSPILTEEGICYTLNTLGAAELFREEKLNIAYEYMDHRNSTHSWTLENGYSSTAPLETYPRRGSGSGLKSGLELVLRIKKKDVDYICSGPIQGYKIALHNPAELPRLSQHYIGLPLSQQVLVAIKPEMITTSSGLQDYDPKRRLCFFQKDRYLQYFNTYTQSNCETECLVNFTYALCGCAHFGLPRGPNMKVCNRKRVLCLIRAQKKLMTIEVQSETETQVANDTFGKARAVAAQCDCLPVCTSLEYDAETSQVDVNVEAYLSALDFLLKDEKTFHLSIVSIYFKEPQFIMSRRSELYGQTDFLANCGGLLGLFMGFSILSIVEILYFLTLRLWYLLSRHRRRSTNGDAQNPKGKLAFD